jgi:GAF domain-containing protein
VEFDQRVRNLKPQLQPALSTEIKITRGHAPAAGFEDAEAPDAGQIASLQAALLPAGSELATAVSDASLRRHELLSVAAVRIMRAVPFDAIAFFFWNGSELSADFVMGSKSSGLERLCVRPGDGLIGWVAELGQPILNGNPSVDPGWVNAHELDSALAVPLRYGQERPAVVAIYRASKAKFSTADLESALALCDPLGRALSATQLEASRAAA